MAIDIVAPNGNEHELITMAAVLGFRGLVLAYLPDHVPDSIDTAHTKLALSFGILVSDRATALAAKRKGYLTLAEGTNDPRNVLETVQPDIVYGLEDSPASDFIHHRNSGFNQVLAKIAKDKKIMVGSDFSRILLSQPGKQSLLMGRIAQNISLCRKYKVNMRIFSFAREKYHLRPPQDLLSFYHELGLSRDRAQDFL